MWDDAHAKAMQSITHRFIFDIGLPFAGLGRIRGNAKLRRKGQRKCRIVTMTLPLIPALTTPSHPHTYTPLPTHTLRLTWATKQLHSYLLLVGTR